MRFTLGAWLITRLVIVAAFVWAVPHAVVPALGNWDGNWYKMIATTGYEFVANGKQHAVAFFPLFPLIASGLSRLGITWPLAGVIVNNTAFLVFLLVLYTFVRKSIDVATARWSVVVACALPLSLFGSVAYAEGLFMLFSVVALACYRRNMYFVAGLAAAGASATRPLGIALALGLIVAALIERRKPVHVLQCATGLLGTAAYALFCWMQFHDPIAFVHVQTAWRPHMGFDWAEWWGLKYAASLGFRHAWMTIAFTIIGVPLIAVFHRKIGVAGLVYATLYMAIIVASGPPLSVDRLLYALVPMLVAIACLCKRWPIVGYIVAAASLPQLFIDAATFAHFHWVA